MDTFQKKRGTGTSKSNFDFRLSPLAAACAMAIAAASAHAQQADPAATDAAKQEAAKQEAAKKDAAKPAKPAAQAVDTVVVTGIRRGIEEAISVKQNASSIVEAISAEDIGKLPDASIAESIARLPGVTAQRSSGRAQQISIRGMSPDFSTALLNGREQVTTGDSRGVEFDQYPAELLSGVVIYKTPDAELVGQGLSGTVDLQTVRPLNFGKTTVAVNYRTQKLGVGTNSEGDGKRFNISYIDQFADRKLGIALGFARLDETSGSTERFESWGGGDATYNGQTVHVPYNGFNWWTDQTKQKRDGAMGVVEFKPSKDFSSVLDLFYSKFESTKSTKGFQAPLNDSWNGTTHNYDPGGVLTSATVSGGNVTAGTFNNVRAVVRNDAESNKDKLTSWGWNNKFTIDKDWTGIIDLSQSTAKRDGVIVETTAGTTQATAGTAQLDSVAFTNAGTFKPGLNYADRSIIKLTDVQGWGGGPATVQAGYTKQPHVEDKINSGRVAAKYNFPEGMMFSDVDFGLNFADREKKREYIEAQLVVPGSPFASAAIPGTGTTTIGTSGITIATFDPVAALSSIYSLNSKQHPDIYNKDWKVKEKVDTLYGKLNIDTATGGVPIRGNLGLQFVKTDQSSTAYSVDKAAPGHDDSNRPANPYTAGTNYSDVLPSMNLVGDLGDGQVLRFALARVMARPTMADMRASNSFSVDTGNASGPIYTGGGGNPLLKPFRANAIDLSYEKYFGTKAYVGLAGFYKKLSTYILTVTDPNYNFASYITPSTPKLPSTIGKFSQPINGEGGNISGVEFSASFPLGMATDVLDGFGILGSYSSTSSSLNLSSAGLTTDGLSGNIPLPGLSKNVSNVTLYYEKYGFSARISQRGRSDFIGEVSSFTGDRQLTYIKSEKITDAQIGYDFSWSYLKGLSILFQVYNLSDEPFIRYRDTPSNVIEKTKYGKTYLLGLTYKM